MIILIFLYTNFISIKDIEKYNGFTQAFFDDLVLVSQHLPPVHPLDAKSWVIEVDNVLKEVRMSWWRLVKRYHYSMKIERGDHEWLNYVMRVNQIVILVRDAKMQNF